MKYGDYDNVTKDVKALNDIIDRQGATLLLEVIAEKLGDASIKFKLTDEENKRALDSYLAVLKEAVLERI